MEKSLENLEIDDPARSGDVQTRIRGSITNGLPIRLVAHVITPQAEEILKAVLEGILENYGAGDLKMTGQIIVKELTTNAVKANLKHFLLLQKQSDADFQPAVFMAEFRKILSTGGALPYRDELIKAGLRVDTVFQFDAEKIVLSVSNGFCLEGDEKKRLLEKMAQATVAGDMRKFFEHNRGDAEGAGLGFTLVVNSLKSAGIDPGAFTFDMDAEKGTTARVVIPLGAAKNQGE